MAGLRMTEAELLARQQKQADQVAQVKAKVLAEVPAAKLKDSQQRLRALGHLKPGEMNKTEQRYHDHLQLQKQAGLVLWFEFESIKLKLCDNTHFTPDFALMGADGVLELHDVKGSRAIIKDDAHLKMKWAADRYPFRICYVFPVKGGGWEIEEV
jgi:hypothetical protein